jgi:ArsR family transcriptional regulator, arsenate/arsenite/antimonite-responsive transcriptional repressor / arsenate reductase (thioredoxin)
MIESMDTERLSRQQRADRHAALSDVSRLAIVDALALTDLSPGEVGRLLDAPSNLVAHHLRVLREAGLVTQVRSEGDARRTYIQLVPEALGGLIVCTPWTADRVVFVCRHNSARSQLAEALWRQVSDVPVASAGTHPAARVHPGAVAVARRHRLRMPKPKTQSLADVHQASDLLVALCDEAHEELAAGRGGQVLHWSVPDPARVGTDDAFDEAYEQISARVQRAATSNAPTQEVSR